MKKRSVAALCAVSLLLLAGCGKNTGDTVNNYYQETPQWTLVGNMGAYNSAQVLAVSGNYLFAGTQAGVYRSSDNGASWTGLTSGLPAGHNITTPLFVNGNYLFANVSFYDTILFQSLNEIYRSSDNGNSWTPTGFPDPDTMDVFSFASNSTYLFASARWYDGTTYRTYFYVYRSSDNGNSWTLTGLPDTLPISRLAVNGNTLFGWSDFYYGIYRSSDNGTSWTNIFIDSTLAVTDLAVNGSTLFLASNYGVYRSTDNGTTWTGTSLIATTADIAVSGSTLFATTRGGVLCSTNNGATWAQAGNGLDGVICQQLIVYNGYLIVSCAGPMGGIWRLPLADLN